MDSRTFLRRGLIGTGVAVAALVLYWSVGIYHYEGFRLGFGSIHKPRARMAQFIACWTFFGGFASVALAAGLAGWAGEAGDRPWMSDAAALPRDRTLLLAAGGAALVVPVAIRAFVLDGAPMTDDESAYRFMAELIASGRLVGESPPPAVKLFFDRFQMINDGTRYSQYFVGWPALMAPGVWLGLEEWMNALYAAATIPAIHGVATHLRDRRTAIVADLLVVTSPFLMVAAATMGSHTSCIAALAWMYWAFFRTRTDDARLADHALLATFFSVAFFIRPLAALGLGAPLLAVWAWNRVSLSDGRWRALAAFTLPAVGFAALFFAVNALQTGSPLSVPYVEFLEYARDNGGRFNGIRLHDRSSIPNLSFANVFAKASLVGTGLLRFDASLFGWPLSLLFVLVAGLDRDTRLVWASAAGYLATRFLLKDPGVDLFGPVHFQELALPVVLLSAVGLVRLADGLAHLGTSDGPWSSSALRPLPWTYLGGAILLAGVGYLPVRFQALSRAAHNTAIPERALRQAGVEDAVIFTQQPFVPNCLGPNANHFVFWRPVNPPDFRAEILWVNHVTAEDDRKFMAYAPGRKGYILRWKKRCEPRLVPVESPGASETPRGRMGGTGEGPDWSKAPPPDAYSLPTPPD